MRKVEYLLLSGTMRSGTTLMASVLNAHPDVCIISDTLNWFWRRFFPFYGQIDSEYELDRVFFELEPFIYQGLTNDQINFIKNGSLKSEVLQQGISNITLYNSLIRLSFYEQVREIKGIKATHHAICYEDFINHTPNAFIIHMLRDSRDVFYSHKKRIIKHAPDSFSTKIRSKLSTLKTSTGKKLAGEFYFNVGKRAFTSLVYQNPVKIFDDWVYENDKAIHFAEKHPDNIIIIKYEEFVTNPEVILKKISAKLNIEWNEKYFLYENLKDRQGKSFVANTSSQKEINKGISNTSISKGKMNLSESENEYFIRVAKKLSDKLGY